MSKPIINLYLSFITQGRIFAIISILAILLPATNTFAQTLNDVKILVNQHALEFEVEADVLREKAKDYRQAKITDVQLQQQLLKTRLAYKKLEFLYTYYYPEHVEAHINGVPIPHLDPYPFKELPLPESYYNEPSFIQLPPLDYQEDNAYIKPRLVLEPVGLQALDTLIFSDEIDSKKDEIATLSEKIALRSRIMVQAINKRIYIEPYQIFEAARLELVRIFTQGITGYDTPGSLNGLAEAKISLESMQAIIMLSIKTLPEKQKVDVKNLFNKAKRYLDKHQDFEQFDRLAFLKLFIDPLYDRLLSAHQNLHLKTTAEITGETTSWNFSSTNLFAENFLNPYFYGLLPQNKDSEALRQLGEQIFNDTIISQNNSMSCASCHLAEKAFTDGLPKSRTSKADEFVMRNAPSLINAIFSKKFFYDLRANNPNEQFKHVIVNPLEFNTSFEEITRKLNQDKNYIAVFANIFHSNDQPINRHQVSAALTSYLISLRSFDSPFDQYVRNERKTIEPEVKAGFNLFMGKAQCGTCHFPPTFSGLVPPLYQENDSEVLGVFDAPNSGKIDRDLGRSDNKVFQEDIDIYLHSFKTPGLRNAALTAPYFHNGAYKNIDEVIEFYDKGGAQGQGLRYEVPNQTLSAIPLKLTEKEKSSLKAFINSLTDLTLTKKFPAYTKADN